MKLIVGLGNPEERYAGTRHNLGFAVVDEFRRKLNAPEWSLDERFKSEISRVSPDLMLVRPRTYMNNSGMAVANLARYFKVAPQDILVVHDDLDLKLKQIKVRMGGAAAGHHGVESIISALGTDAFARLRLGIGNLRSHSGEHNRISFNAEHFVLEPFMPSEKGEVKSMVKQSLKALEIYLKDGIERAQSQFN